MKEMFRRTVQIHVRHVRELHILDAKKVIFWKLHAWFIVQSTIRCIALYYANSVR